MKRTVAGTIVALLVAVTSMAAACDLSCAFGMAESDCHSDGARAQTSMESAMDMSGMDMSGMIMPGMASYQSQPLDSTMSRTDATHPSIGDMGPCERQSCDRGSFVATKSGRSNNAVVSCIGPVAADSVDVAFAQSLHSARDDISQGRPFHASLLALVLRI